LLAPGTRRARIDERLRFLHQAGYLLRARPRNGDYYAYLLSKKGIEAIARLYGVGLEDLDWSPGDADIKHLFLHHQLFTSQMRIAISQAADRHGFSLEQWHNERALHRLHKDASVTIEGDCGEVKETHLYPDGYFLLRKDRYAYHRFLEVDRGTETIATESDKLTRTWWGRKIASYQAFY
jgi:hypothetical protein